MEHELLSVLQATLNPAADIRIAAEARLSELQRQPESCLALATLCLSPQIDVSLRQMSFAPRCSGTPCSSVSYAAGLTLRRYVPMHWSPFFEKFQGDAPSYETKVQVRQLLFRGLADPVRKVRLSCAYTTSELAHADWPDEYPQLMDLLLDALSEGQEQAVDGALRVLTEFVKADLSEDQLLPTAQKMLPQLLVILNSTQRYSAVSRARALAVFRQSVLTLHTVKDQFPEAVATAIDSILPQWLDALAHLLGHDVARDVTEESRWGELAIRTEAFRTLDTILNGFPKSMSAHTAALVDISLAHLNALAPPIRLICQVEDAELEAPYLADEGSDVSVDVTRLASFILDFVVHLARKKTAHTVFLSDHSPASKLANLANLIIHFAQVTREDEESWAEDLNVFVGDAEDYALVFSLRVASYDAAESLLDTFGRPALQALWSAMQGVCEQASVARETGASEWWKGIEATLAVACAISDTIIDARESPVIDLSRLFQMAVVPYMDPAAPMYLQGRAFVLASLCAAILPAEMAMNFVKHAIHTLALEAGSVPVKVSAVRALMNFFKNLPEITKPYAARAISLFAPLLPQASGSTLVLIVESIQAALQSDTSGLNPADVSIVLGTLLDVWQNNLQDPTVDSAVLDLLATFSNSRSSITETCLIGIVLPRLAQMLSLPPETPIPASAVSAIDSICSERKGRLGERFFATFGGPLFALLEFTDDRQIVQDGLDIVTRIIRIDSDQVLSWNDAGSTGRDHILRILSKRLDVSQPEDGGLFVGDLVLHLLRKATEIVLPVLPDLLRALIYRLPTAQTASFIQSLILPIAYLMYGQLETVASLLEQTNVDGRPAIEVLVVSWCDQVETIQGYWNRRISVAGLAQLLISRRPSLEELHVKGDLIVNDANRNVIMTRARKKLHPDQYTNIPFPAKVLKILAKELISLQEESHDVDDAALEADAGSDDGNDEWEEEDGGFTSQKDFAYLNPSLLDPDAPPDHQADEEDLQDDPVYTLDLPAFIVSALKQAVAEDAQRIHSLASSLTVEEADVLRRVVR